MIAFHFHYAHRESTRNNRKFALMKKFSLWKRWMLFIWRSIQVFWKNHEITERIFVNWMKNLHRTSSCRRNDSIVDFLVLKVNQLIVMRDENSINKSIVDLFALRISQSINRRFSCFRINQFIHQMISTILIFLKRWDIAR